MSDPHINPFVTPETIQASSRLSMPESERRWSTLVTGIVGGVLLGATYGAGSAGLLGVLFCMVKTEDFHGGDELLGTAFAIGSAGAFIGGFVGSGAGALVGSLSGATALWGRSYLTANLPWITAVMAMLPAGGAGCLAGLLFGGFSSPHDMACIVLGIVIGLAAGWFGGYQLGVVVRRGGLRR